MALLCYAVLSVISRFVIILQVKRELFAFRYFLCQVTVSVTFTYFPRRLVHSV